MLTNRNKRGPRPLGGRGRGEEKKEKPRKKTKRNDSFQIKISSFFVSLKNSNIPPKLQTQIKSGYKTDREVSKKYWPNHDHVVNSESLNSNKMWNQGEKKMNRTTGNQKTQKQSKGTHSELKEGMKQHDISYYSTSCEHNINSLQAFLCEHRAQWLTTSESHYSIHKVQEHVCSWQNSKPWRTESLQPHSIQAAKWDIPVPRHHRLATNLLWGVW